MGISSFLRNRAYLIEEWNTRLVMIQTMDFQA